MAEAFLRLTAKDLKAFNVIDEILPEPPGGAHMDPALMAETITAAIRKHLKVLRKLKPEALVTRRLKKFQAMGIFSDR